MEAKPRPEPGIVLRVALGDPRNHHLLIVEGPGPHDSSQIRMTYVMPDDGRLAFKVDPIEGIAYKDRLNMQYEIFTPEPPWYALLDRDKWDQFLGGGFWEERGPA